MNVWIKASIVGVSTLLAIAITAPTIADQEIDVRSLRGMAELDEPGDPGELVPQNTEHRFQRAYRQQPPMIPHKIDKYQINLKVNQCLRCHDWPYNVTENAPKVSETHYVDRNGVALDRVTQGRWFCIQCHVPQTEASAAVPNTFKSAAEVE
jgi:nitrate reductase (cytochrome), electron transfer subunit